MERSTINRLGHFYSWLIPYFYPQLTKDMAPWQHGFSKNHQFFKRHLNSKSELSPLNPIRKTTKDVRGSDFPATAMIFQRL